MTVLEQGRDAAFPQNLTGYTGVIFGYFGGPRAYNVWTGQQWLQFRVNRKVPIWVGGLDGVSEGHAAIVALQALGASHCVVMLDMETRVDKTYVTNFANILNGAHYKVWVYGSAGTVFSNPQADGYVVADPTGVVHMYPHAGVRGTQWAFGDSFDSDVVREWVIEQDELWQ